ncbi:MAG: hypothetical protein H6Q65_2218 [Firmicutes bacterium]|nr:hypothetical protein [Bacillota bacterium]
MTKQTAGLAGRLLGHERTARRFDSGCIAVIGKKTSGKFYRLGLFLYRRDKNIVYFYLEYRMTTTKK